MSFYGWPISQCQESSTPLAIQLQSGIRVLDIRLAIVNSRLIAYHGIISQRTPFQDILSTLHDFLTDPSTSRETIVMSIKQEDFEKNSVRDFSRLVHEEIFCGPGGSGMWYFSNCIPSLGDVRGKVVLFSRFGGNGEGWEGRLEGLGIHPSTWPDSEKFGFSWFCKDTLVQTHDWCVIPTCYLQAMNLIFFGATKKGTVYLRSYPYPKNSLSQHSFFFHPQVSPPCPPLPSLFYPRRHFHSLCPPSSRRDSDGPSGDWECTASTADSPAFCWIVWDGESWMVALHMRESTLTMSDLSEVGPSWTITQSQVLTLFRCSSSVTIEDDGKERMLLGTARKHHLLVLELVNTAVLQYICNSESILS